MARQSKTGKKTTVIVIATLGALILALFALLGLQSFLNPHRTVATLDVATYVESANSLRGNVYKVVGTVTDTLAWSPSGGFLITVKPKDDRRQIPVFIPRELQSINIQKGQQLLLVVEVDAKGVLQARNITKT